MDGDSIDVCVEGMTSDTFEVVDEREPRVLLAFVWALSLVPTITTLMTLDEDMTTLVRRFLVEAVVLIVVAVWVERRSTERRLARTRQDKNANAGTDLRRSATRALMSKRTSDAAS